MFSYHVCCRLIAAFRVFRLQRSQTNKLQSVQTEMEGLKREKIQLRKRMKEEAVAHREWKNERELELRQMVEIP